MYFWVSSNGFISCGLIPCLRSGQSMGGFSQLLESCGELWLKAGLFSSDGGFDDNGGD